MTKLLEQALSKIHKLPDAKQDAIANLILGELGEQTLDRRSLLKLPIEARRQVLAEQAEQLLEHYQTDETWRETEVGDLFEY